MDWSHVLGWGSPIGWGAFLFGLGMFFRGLMHKSYMWAKGGK